ncbi:ABC transporter ATP-binding protein [Corticicoccus populi]|uniref:ABC transporter ATP-binding protein n=1 Tax=Corticicoccus populi TaxID=1812821 RepID=A0ABW5WSW8_9STAP
MFDILIKLKWYFKKHKLKYGVILVLLLMQNVLDTLPPLFLGRVIDQISSGSMTQELMWESVGLLLSIILISYLFNYTWGYLLFGGAYDIESIIRTRLMGKFLLLSPSFYERNKTGDLMAKATNDLRSVNVALGFGVLTLLDSTVFLLTIVIVMGVTISWPLTFLAMLPLPLLAVIEAKIGKRINETHSESQKSFGAMNDSVLEVVEGVRLTRSFVQEDAENKRFRKMTGDYLDKFMKVERLDALFRPLTIIITTASFVTAFAFGSVLVNRGQITTGDIVAFNIYLNMLVWPMFAIGMLFNIMQRGNASYNRIIDVLDVVDDVGDDAVEKIENTSMNFSDVTFRYPTGDRESLQDINIELKAGETLGVVGRTASGKSTLIKQLLKFYPSGSGQLIIDGVKVSELSKSELREKIGYVSQENILFSRTVKENILFGRPDATEEEMFEAIRLSAFDQDLKNMPQGLETLVGEKGVALSGGQKQRISIARSLIKNPDILILDDALSAVDAKTEKRIIESIQKSRADKTTIIVTHRLSAVQHADLIIVMDDGEIIEIGDHKTLSSKEGWYSTQHSYYQTGGGPDDRV